MLWPCTTTLEMRKLAVHSARGFNFRLLSMSSFSRRYTPSYNAQGILVRPEIGFLAELSLLTKELIATTRTPSMQVIAITEASIACATRNVSTGPLAPTNLDRWLPPTSNKRILPADGSTWSPSKTIVPAAKYVRVFPSTVRSTTDTEITSSSGSHAYESRPNKGIIKSILKRGSPTHAHKSGHR